MPVITATANRHRMFTRLWQLDASDEQVNSFMEHLGHSVDIDKNIYACPLPLQAAKKVMPLLETINQVRWNQLLFGKLCIVKLYWCKKTTEQRQKRRMKQLVDMRWGKLWLQLGYMLFQERSEEKNEGQKRQKRQRVKAGARRDASPENNSESEETKSEEVSFNVFVIYLITLYLCFLLWCLLNRIDLCLACYSWSTFITHLVLPLVPTVLSGGWIFTTAIAALHDWLFSLSCIWILDWVLLHTLKFTSDWYGRLKLKVPTGCVGTSISHNWLQI